MRLLSRVKNRVNYTIQFGVDLIANKYAGLYTKRAFLNQYQVWGDESRLKIAPTAIVNNALFNLSSGNIILEDYVFFGHNVTILTGTHDVKKCGLERINKTPKTGRDVLIKKGVFVASNATILGPCVIGENAVIGACCFIHEDVPSSTICYANNPIILKKINLDPQACVQKKE
jgi:acetyltransferase-like isoleucine patch superfamily enzyme